MGQIASDPSNSTTNSEAVTGGVEQALRETLIVVPTLNEEAHIEACLRSLLSDQIRAAGTKIIVADGGSTDKTRSIVRSLQSEFETITLLDNPERLQSAALNHAVETYGAEPMRFMVRCDAHADYPSDFVARIVARLEETAADSVVIPMDSKGLTCFGRAAAWIVDTPLGNGGAAHRAGLKSGFVDHGHHAGFRLDSFRRLGGYDRSFSHNEDAEYDVRLSRIGGRIYMAADIRMDYVVRSTPVALARQYINYGKGRARNCLKHRTPPRPRQALPIAALFANLGSLFVSPWFPLALALPGVYLLLLSIASVYIALSRKSACGLWAGPASGIMHMSWAAGFLMQLFRLRSQDDKY